MDSQILEILVKHKLTPSIELLEAMRDVYNAGAATAAPSTGSNGDDGDDDEPASLSVGDIAALRKLGIDPGKKMRRRNSVFTVTGYKPSRWKYPISVQTQQGARYKMTVMQVLDMQRNS